MQKFNIPLGGMTNTPDDNFSQDGDMQLLLNMRNEGGELTVINAPTKKDATEKVKVIDAKYHAASNTWLEIRNGALIIPAYALYPNTKLYTAQDEEVLTDVQIMGNIVILNRTVDDKKAKPIYLQWKGGIDGAPTITELPTSPRENQIVIIGADRIYYEDTFFNKGDVVRYKKEKWEKYYGFDVLGVFPEIPELALTVTEGIKTVDTTQYYYDGVKEETDNPENELLWINVSKGYFDKCLSLLYGDAMFVDRTLVRVVFRLFDGSVVEHSQVYYIESNREKITVPDITSEGAIVGDDSWNFQDFKFGDGNRSLFRVAIKGFTLGIELKDFVDLSLWEDVISGIEVYATPSIMGHAADNKSEYIASRWAGDDNIRGVRDVYSSAAYERYRTLTSEEIVDSIESADLFYKIREFDLSGKEVWKAKSTAPSEMAVQDRLNNNEMPHVVLPADGVTNYNRKMHLSGVNELLHLPYNVARVSSATNSADPNIEVVQATQISSIVRIQTNEGIRTVVDNFYNVPVAKRDGSVDISQYISYPDSRAKEMEVIVHLGTNGLSSEWYRTTFKLKAHNTLNLAYSIGPALGISAVGTGVGGNSVMKWTDMSNGTSVTWPTYDDGTFEINSAYAKNDRLNVKKNTLKVSAVDNPFFFPAVQTYTFEGDVIGVASNTEAVSSGQFGQYPLYVFSDKGIWTMAVDTSGKGAYTSAAPMSREVCSGAICPISGGVVFTTEKAVMIISGAGITDISAALDGEAMRMAKYSEELYEQIIGRQDISNLNVVPIRDYLKKMGGIVLAYNYKRNEVYLSGGSWTEEEVQYSYVYNLRSQRWSIGDFNFNLTTNSYPELVVYDYDKQLSFDDVEDKSKVVAISRPIKLGTTEYKRLRQAALRGTFTGPLDFYLLGSHDGAAWVCIGGKEVAEDKEHRDIVTQMFRSKQYRFLAFAFVGSIKGRLSMVEMMADGAFADNKLR